MTALMLVTSSKWVLSSPQTRCKNISASNTRFYAQHLAAPTTLRGEILKETCELAEKYDLEVVYGDTDTDSVFVNSKQNSVEEALNIANQFKKEVDGRCRLLEIDIGGVFQRLLLLQKKYVAIKRRAISPPWKSRICWLVRLSSRGGLAL